MVVLPSVWVSLWSYLISGFAASYCVSAFINFSHSKRSKWLFNWIPTYLIHIMMWCFTKLVTLSFYIAALILRLPVNEKAATTLKHLKRNLALVFYSFWHVCIFYYHNYACNLAIFIITSLHICLWLLRHLIQLQVRFIHKLINSELSDCWRYIYINDTQLWWKIYRVAQK